MEYDVSKSGNDINSGALEKPFLTILKAADVAERAILLLYTKVFTENVLLFPTAILINTAE